MEKTEKINSLRSKRSKKRKKKTHIEHNPPNNNRNKNIQLDSSLNQSRESKLHSSSQVIRKEKSKQNLVLTPHASNHAYCNEDYEKKLNVIKNEIESNLESDSGFFSSDTETNLSDLLEVFKINKIILDPISRNHKVSCPNNDHKAFVILRKIENNLNILFTDLKEIVHKNIKILKEIQMALRSKFTSRSTMNRIDLQNNETSNTTKYQLTKNPNEKKRTISDDENNTYTNKFWQQNPNDSLSSNALTNLSDMDEDDDEDENSSPKKPEPPNKQNKKQNKGTNSKKFKTDNQKSDAKPETQKIDGRRNNGRKKLTPKEPLQASPSNNNDLIILQETTNSIYNPNYQNINTKAGVANPRPPNFTQNSFPPNTINPNQAYNNQQPNEFPILIKNQQNIPKPKTSLLSKDLPPPIIIKLKSDQECTTDIFKNQIYYLKQNYQIFSTHNDKRGDLVVRTINKEDVEKIMNDEKFFQGYEKRNLGVEASSIIFNNISYDEINDDDELIDELYKIGIVDIAKLNPNQSSDVKLVKAYCNDEKTMMNLINNNIKIQKSNGELYIIKTGPNVPPTEQCTNCWDYGHKEGKSTDKNACLNRNKTVCAKCGQNHLTTKCQNNELRCINCGNQHDARSRSLCEYYKKFRKIEVKEANNLSKQGKYKPKINTKAWQYPNESTRICSYQEDLETMSRDMQTLKDSTDSLWKSNIKMSEDNATTSHLILEKLTSIENNIITKCKQ